MQSKLDIFWFYLNGQKPEGIAFTELEKRSLYKGFSVIFAQDTQSLAASDADFNKRVYGIIVQFGKSMSLTKTEDLLWHLCVDENNPLTLDIIKTLAQETCAFANLHRQIKIYAADQKRLQNELKLSASAYQKYTSQLRDDAENKIRRTQAQLVQSAKLAALGEMSSGIAHEINNPLYLIQGFANQLKKQLAKGPNLNPEKAADAVDEILNNCERMDKIVKHFREFSRQADYELKIVAINDIIKRAFEFFQQQLSTYSIAAEFSLTEAAFLAAVDPNRLEQVFVNLIGNARDAIVERNGSKGGRIHFVTQVDAERGYVEIHDDGYGVAGSARDKLFDPFFTTKEVGKGTGLGLSISHQIIKEHRGNITFGMSALGGAVFKVELPLVKEEGLEQSAS